MYFGPGLYLCMLGDVHIEHSMLIMHGEIIKGSALECILEQQKLSTIGTSSIVDANDIKRSRYCLQVSLCTIYWLLKDAHKKSESCLSPIKWLDEKRKSNQMCFYWKLIIDFQINISVICSINSPREFYIVSQYFIRYVKVVFFLR